jgi:hypothetical protein
MLDVKDCGIPKYVEGVKERVSLGRIRVSYQVLSERVTFIVRRNVH